MDCTLDAKVDGLVDLRRQCGGSQEKIRTVATLGACFTPESSSADPDAGQHSILKQFGTYKLICNIPIRICSHCIHSCHMRSQQWGVTMGGDVKRANCTTLCANSHRQAIWRNAHRSHPRLMLCLCVYMCTCVCEREREGRGGREGQRGVTC
eukprot:1149603-Pelagomonas_calceolata.AAC.5